MEVHVTGPTLHCDRFLNTSSVLTEAKLHQKGAYEIEDCIVDIHWNEFESRFEVQIEWRGFAKEESTWEPLSVIYADAPQAVLLFLFKRKDVVSRKALDSLQAEGGM